MEFNPGNPVIRLCVQGMGMEESANPEAAAGLFLQAWNEASNDFERFTAAYFVARHQSSAAGRLNWLETALQAALNINNVSVQSAYPSLFRAIAKCYEDLNDPESAKKHYDSAALFEGNPSDQGPFYHGTRADLKPGDFLTPGGKSNYQADLQMKHIYFTALPNGAGLAAALAQGERRERVYIVEPKSFENDPNVTDKRFPGNPTRSYRSREPLKIVGELEDWVRQTPEEIQRWRERLANSKGEIID